MVTKFERERGLAEYLFRDIGAQPDAYRDPHAQGRAETGVDVVVVFGKDETGIQVTELDTGPVAGEARRDEKQTQRQHQAAGHATYGSWGQNDPNAVVASIARAVSRKAAIADRHDLSRLKETWLLISAGVPEMGSAVSSFVMTPWLSAEALTAATGPVLQRSKFQRAFLHPILSPEPVLYRWDASTGRWVKTRKANAA